MTTDLLERNDTEMFGHVAQCAAILIEDRWRTANFIVATLKDVELDRYSEIFWMEKDGTLFEASENACSSSDEDDPYVGEQTERLETLANEIDQRMSQYEDIDVICDLALCKAEDQAWIDELYDIGEFVPWTLITMLRALREEFQSNPKVHLFVYSNIPQFASRRDRVSDRLRRWMNPQGKPVFWLSSGCVMGDSSVSTRRRDLASRPWLLLGDPEEERAVNA